MCREDDGELLSIESESEQKLMEMFLRGATVAEGDFWIGLRRNQGYKESGAAECSLQYYWLDHSQATYRYGLCYTAYIFCPETMKLAKE